jgi:hypothetical protein
MVWQWLDTPSVQQKERLPIPRPAIESPETPATVVGEELSRISRL